MAGILKKIIQISVRSHDKTGERPLTWTAAFNVKAAFDLKVTVEEGTRV